MADEADIANDYHELLISNALNKMVRQATSSKAGAKNCAECEEPIATARRKLGFSLCFQCAEETERRKALFANY
ncbi:MAG: TraR/DksA family transcriptional regulator [Pseudomonadota bacterium]